MAMLSQQRMGGWVDDQDESINLICSICSQSALDSDPRASYASTSVGSHSTG